MTDSGAARISLSYAATFLNAGTRMTGLTKTTACSPTVAGAMMSGGGWAHQWRLNRERRRRGENFKTFEVPAWLK
jgi:hypothetical protein